MLFLSFITLDIPHIAQPTPQAASSIAAHSAQSKNAKACQPLPAVNDSSIKPANKTADITAGASLAARALTLKHRSSWIESMSIAVAGTSIAAVVLDINFPPCFIAAQGQGSPRTQS